MMKFSTPYTHSDGEQFATKNDEASMTQQSDMAEADINVILKKFGVSGQVPGVLQEGIYGDFTQVTDYRTAMDMIRAADEAFQGVPANIRELFGNDPAKFMEYAGNPENVEQMVDWGLAEKRPQPPMPQPDEVINDSPNLQHLRQEGGGVEPPIPPTNAPTRGPNLPNGGPGAKPK